MNAPAIPPPRILIADDESSIRDALSLALEREGFRVTSVCDGRQAWDILRSGGGTDLAILDIMMGGLEGTAVLARLRAAGSRLPVILLTSRDEELDRVVGLEMGADDYIGKPFSVKELCARVRAVLRRSQAQAAEPEKMAASRSGQIEVDGKAFRAWAGGTELSLTITEFRVLSALFENRGSALSREQLLERAYPLDGYVAERSVDSHVKRLRKKLSEALSGHEEEAGEHLIQTVYGLGYRMREER